MRKKKFDRGVRTLVEQVSMSGSGFVSQTQYYQCVVYIHFTYLLILSRYSYIPLLPFFSFFFTWGYKSKSDDPLLRLTLIPFSLFGSVSGICVRPTSTGVCGCTCDGLFPWPLLEVVIFELPFDTKEVVVEDLTATTPPLPFDLPFY